MVYAIQFKNEALDSSVWILSGFEEKLEKENFLIKDAFDDFLTADKSTDLKLATAWEEFEDFCFRHLYVLDCEEDKLSKISNDEGTYYYEGEPISILEEVKVRF